MASSKHNFIVSAISRKIRKDNFNIIYFDGKYQDVDTKKFDIPPKIINHRPDIIGEIENKFFCIGEAKTEADLFTERTKNQIIDFFSLISINDTNKLFLGIPLSAKKDLEKLLANIGLLYQKQIDIIYIPDNLLPNEEEV